jgi:hypothetical protein
MTRLAISLCLLFFSLSGQAQQKELQTAGSAGAVGEAPATFQKQWFFVLGTSNYRVRLEESEDQIDNQINRLLGSVLPSWDKPTTFKDWSDNGRIWDLWAGFGRDICARSSWAVYAGGGQGTIPNEGWYYPVGIPLKIDVDFTRRSLFAGASVSYYPLGRPTKPEGVQKGHGVIRAFKAGRPVVECNVGTCKQTVIGDVRITNPIVGRLLRIRQDDEYDLLFMSPRLSFEAPVTRKDSVTFMTGYTFFNDHETEFNSSLFQIFWRRRF